MWWRFYARSVSYLLRAQVEVWKLRLRNDWLRLVGLGIRLRILVAAWRHGYPPRETLRRIKDGTF